MSKIIPDKFQDVFVPTVKEVFGVNFSQILPRNKKQSVSSIRACLIYCANVLKVLDNKKEISRKFQRDNATIHYSINKGEGLYNFDKEFTIWVNSFVSCYYKNLKKLLDEDVYIYDFIKLVKNNIDKSDSDILKIIKDEGFKIYPSVTRSEEKIRTE